MELSAKEIKRKKLEQILKLLREADLIQQGLECDGEDISIELIDAIDHFSDCLKLL